MMWEVIMSIYGKTNTSKSSHPMPCRISTLMHYTEQCFRHEECEYLSQFHSIDFESEEINDNDNEDSDNEKNDN